MPVLVLGETGTGKSMLAKSMHDLSGRAGRFVRVDCASIPESLIESQLFGHEKGAYTDAHRRSIGLFEQSHNGTLFLDEVQNLTLSVQSKLLVVLEEKSIRRIGGTEDHPLDFRLISASNDDLSSCVEAGDFRRDLYYRLKGAVIRLPALRDHKEDIPTLSRYFLQHYNSMHGTEKRFTAEVMRCLQALPLPGNVRELMHKIEEAAAISESDMIGSDDFMFDEPLPQILDACGSGYATLAEMEKQYIQLILRATDFNKTKAAGVLQIGLNTLYRKIRKYDLNLC